MLFDEACSTAQEFTKLYYDCLDKKRNVKFYIVKKIKAQKSYIFLWFQLLSKLYMETAVLVWNGSSVTGNSDIQAFLEKLPASEHQIISLDAQPLHGNFQN